MTILKDKWLKHPLFAGLSESYIDLMDAAASVETFESRELIFHEGEEADKFYLITEGNVAVEMFAPGRGPVTIQSVGIGEVLGWSWLLRPYRWHFDAQATAPTEAVIFDAKLLRANFDDRPEFGYAMVNRFLPIIVERLQGTRLQLLDVYHVHG